MTPRSSWWQSTAERGGGLVCWLETLRALVAAPPACNTIFTANSGHELGHLGLDDFSARRPGWERPGGATWVHYGANIGAVGGELSVLSASEDLAARAAQELTRNGCAPDRIAPPSLVPSGETRDIHLAGGLWSGVTLYFICRRTAGRTPSMPRWSHELRLPSPGWSRRLRARGHKRGRHLAASASVVT